MLVILTPLTFFVYILLLAMPTCWDGKSLGDDNDHKSHMAYTTNGRVDGPCPSGFDRRLPQIQLFVRIVHYKGGEYQLSNGSNEWHVDFFNGWKEGKLQDIIDNCEVDDGDDYGYNPPCACTPDSEDGSNFLTENTQAARPLCDIDVRKLVLDEAVDFTNKLPSVECEGPALVPKTWTELSDELLMCTPSDGGETSMDDDVAFVSFDSSDPDDSSALRVSSWSLGSSLGTIVFLAMLFL